MRSMFRALCGSLLLPAALAAQATTPAGMPKVGDVAPDFTLAAATNAGISAKPVTLSSLKGRTVVLAFFPRQRSSGCTIQMQAYRDKYDSLFHNGNGVALFGISTDSTKDLASWAAEAHFQFTFLSAIVNADAGMKYATWPAQGSTSSAWCSSSRRTARSRTSMNPFQPE